MAVRARPQRDGSFDVTERLFRRLDVVNGSIVSSRPAVDAIPPTDWTLARSGHSQLACANVSIRALLRSFRRTT
jgi:hypothetical protein